MPTPFEIYTMAQAKDALGKTMPISVEDADANTSYYQGEHWQGGAGWSGPFPKLSEPGALQAQLEIQKAFVSQNVIKEIVDRHASAVVGREAPWALSIVGPDGVEPEQLTDEQKKSLAEINDALIAWWDERGIAEIVRAACTNSLTTGKGTLRLFVPRGLIDEIGNFKEAKDFKSALMQFVYLESGAYDMCGVYVDMDYAKELSITDVTKKAQGSTKELEVSFVDDDGQSIIRIYSEASKDDLQISQSVEIPDLGNLLVFQLRRTPFVSLPLITQQKFLNLALTMHQRNTVTAGFLERILLDVQIPGKEIDDPANPGHKKFVPEPLKFGGGNTNAFVGVEQGADADGNPVYGKPSVVYREPVDVSHFVETHGHIYSVMLREAKQIHVQMSADATASGESRIQARADFIQSVIDTKTNIQNAVRWLITTAIGLGRFFSKTTADDKQNTIRVSSQIFVQSGPLSADEQRLVLELHEAGLISLETALVMLGIDDPDSEMQAILNDRSITALKAKTGLMESLANSGVSMEQAARLVGFSEDEIKQLVTLNIPITNQ